MKTNMLSLTSGLKQNSAPCGHIFPICEQTRIKYCVTDHVLGVALKGSDNGLFKSADRGQSWKQIQNEGWVMDMVESEDVLIATGPSGIMRSTDKGEHWEWVISEGGVGIAVERICCYILRLKNQIQKNTHFIG